MTFWVKGHRKSGEQNQITVEEMGREGLITPRRKQSLPVAKPENYLIVQTADFTANMSTTCTYCLDV